MRHALYQHNLKSWKPVRCSQNGLDLYGSSALCIEIKSSSYHKSLFIGQSPFGEIED